jgi:hypothetical protein
VQRAAQARREQSPGAGVADAQRGGDLAHRAARDARQGDGVAFGAGHAREGGRGRPAHGGQHGVAYQLALRGVARRGAQDPRRHVPGDAMIAAGRQRGAPHGIEVVLDHCATLREPTSAVIDRKAESRGQASGPRQANAKAIG